MSIEELRKAFESGENSERSEKFFQEFIREIDQDGNKKVELREFIDYMQNIAEAGVDEE